MTPANASGPIEKPIGKYQIAQSTTGRCQLVYLGVARDRDAEWGHREQSGPKCRHARANECGGLFDVRAAEVDFKAANDRPPLPVVAKLEAEHAALRSRVGSRRHGSYEEGVPSDE